METIRKIKMFANHIEDGEECSELLGEFNSLEEIKIRPRDFDKDVWIELEEYWIGEEEK